MNRQNLWYKLIKTGIEGKMLAIIQSLYQNVKCCVKYNGFVSDYFECLNGLFQGEVLSPLLFFMFVNDCEVQCLTDKCPNIDIQMLNLFLLMYADDMVIFAETPDGLQHMLNSLHNYAVKWDLTVNTEKTKVIVFRNGGKIREYEDWSYDGHELEIVDQFNYLGMLLNYNGKFKQTHAGEVCRSRKESTSCDPKCS